MVSAPASLVGAARDDAFDRATNLGKTRGIRHPVAHAPRNVTASTRDNLGGTSVWQHLPSVRPTRCYLICATQRSGSSLLCEALGNTGLAGQPAEYLLSAEAGGWETGEWATRHGVTTRAEYLQLVFRADTGSNGSFGSKLLWEHVPDTLEKLGSLMGGDTDTPPETLLRTVFPRLRYVWLTRRDRVRQAVSWLRAAQSERYNSEMPATSGIEYAYSFQQLDAIVRVIEQAEHGWARYFEGVATPPFRVCYEDFVEAYEQTALDVLTFLGVPFTRPVAFWPRRMERQADADSEAWVARYHAARRGRS